MVRPGFGDCAALSAADAELFRENGRACHTVEDDGIQHAGPSPKLVVGCTAGSLAGSDYSSALEGANGTSAPEEPNAWLTDARTCLPGTLMPHRQADPKVRAAIIRFLQDGGGTTQMQ